MLADGATPTFHFRLPEGPRLEPSLNREGVQPLQEKVREFLAREERLHAIRQRRRFEAIGERLDEIIRVGQLLTPHEIPIMPLLHGEFWADSPEIGCFVLKEDYPKRLHPKLRYKATDGAPKEFLEALDTAVKKIGYRATIINHGPSTRPSPFIVLVPRSEP